MPNLLFNRRSRPKPRAGDVFRLHHTAGGWLFGRIIRADPAPGCRPMPGSLLVYYYAGLRDDPRPRPEWLDRRSLLLPPEWTNTLGWRHGYYETVENVPLGPDDVLERHVFWSWRGERKVYRDECGGVVEPPPGELVSGFGLASYRYIDDLMSDALGVERAPLDEQDRAELARRRHAPSL